MNTEHQSPRTGHRSRALAMGTAAAIVVVGLGAFALIPHQLAQAPAQQADVHPVRYSGGPADPKSAPPPRMLEAGAPFSFADLVERVSPAVVTVTAETTETDQQAALNSPENLPEPFRDFFNQFGGPGGRQFAVPH